MKNRTFIFILGFFTLLFTQCASQKKIQSTAKNATINTEKITCAAFLDIIENNLITDSTLSYNSKLEFIKDDNTNPKVALQIKIRNKQLTWANASLIVPLGRALISPTGAKGYIKFPKKVYFDSDYSFIEEKIQLDNLKYEQIESLITGRPIFTLNDTDYHFTETIEKGEKIYELNYIQNEELLKQKSKTAVAHTLYFDSNYNLIKQLITKPNTTETVEIIYSDFIDLNAKRLPKKMLITAKNIKHTITINLEHKEIVANELLEIPFEIPEGYEKVEFKH